MMGADGLKSKITNNVERRKVGYAEIFSRFGGRYQRITPEGREDMEHFKKEQMMMIAHVNNSQIEPQEMYAKTQGSPRRVFIELQKIRRVG